MYNDVTLQIVTSVSYVGCAIQATQTSELIKVMEVCKTFTKLLLKARDLDQIGNNLLMIHVVLIQKKSVNINLYDHITCTKINLKKIEKHLTFCYVRHHYKKIYFECVMAFALN